MNPPLAWPFPPGAPRRLPLGDPCSDANGVASSSSGVPGVWGESESSGGVSRPYDMSLCSLPESPLYMALHEESVL